jgi:hypothetical protein
MEYLKPGGRSHVFRANGYRNEKRERDRFYEAEKMAQYAEKSGAETPYNMTPRVLVKALAPNRT